MQGRSVEYSISKGTIGHIYEFFGLLLSTLHYFLVFFCEMNKVGLLKDVKRQIGAIFKLILAISCRYIDESIFLFCP